MIEISFLITKKMTKILEICLRKRYNEQSKIKKILINNKQDKKGEILWTFVRWS